MSETWNVVKCKSMIIMYFDCSKQRIDYYWLIGNSWDYENDRSIENNLLQTGLQETQST